ncbi:hypothetical protein A2U01_0064033 [Trifolium medium]|uniref:Uncharacterized protein n=1 Tax=Trifolium medium TaxID=97028 RepID=A0A392S4I7_9FABA|nr:hypothetical protein [Trifolium medium]
MLNKGLNQSFEGFQSETPLPVSLAGTLLSELEVSLHVLDRMNPRWELAKPDSLAGSSLSETDSTTFSVLEF